jgi:hypothetical protein
MALFLVTPPTPSIGNNFKIQNPWSCTKLELNVQSAFPAKLSPSRGVPRILPGGMQIFWLTYPPPPPLDAAPDPHQDFEPDPAPDPHQKNAAQQ